MASIDEKRSSVQRKFDDFFGRRNVEEQCTKETLMNLHEAFLVAENEEMNESQLQAAFEEILKIYIPCEEFHILFMKINLKRDGFVTWNEFISHLLLEFQEKDPSLQRQSLELPLLGVPEFFRTHHRCPVSRITFCPEVFPDRTSSFLRGCYLTVSRDGVINYWSLDLKYERSVHSVNPHLKVQPTAITDMVVMPDVQIVCTSSTERDLRFYDTVAKKFDLRIVMSSFEDAVVCMSYYFSVNIKENSHIVLGDMGGTVKVMSFSPLEKGPFKHTPERDVTHLRYEAVARGELRGMKVTEFKAVHGDWVRQVGYYGSLRAFVSCSRSSECSLLVGYPTGTRLRYRFVVDKGISCFNFCEESQILVTGGPDCTVRIWNPFVPKKASGVFVGHHTAICALVVQNAGKRVYSLSKDKCVKVWDVSAQTCIQTYNGLPSELGERTPMSVVYNPITHKMIIAAMSIVVLVCEQVINRETSDGFTHTKPVTCVLYNHLFKVIVTIGFDSCIIVWDPWLGRRLYLVTNAHSRLLYGEHVGIEITAACFDPSDQLLLTGARDGTLKMWNFNTGTCVRNMAIEDHCQVTSVVWLNNRILCTGWNRRVTEFADSETGIHKKCWETRHTEDVLCSAVCFPQALATASYNGEMVLWRLETGQPYRRYQVSNPTGRYTLTYKKEVKDKFHASGSKSEKKGGARRSSQSRGYTSICGRARWIRCDEQTMIFLTSRPMAPDVGTLLASLESGIIQVWTHHPAAGFLTAFSVIHAQGDYAVSLVTDPNNEYLITGHTIGYIKVWLLKNYALPNPPKLCMPLLRLEFPFLWKDRIDGRAKRAVKGQPLPLLLSSVRGHTKSVNSLQFIPSARIVVSGSSDHTVRLWTLGGRYISTLGTFRTWTPIVPDLPVFRYMSDYRLPPDIKRVASFTSMKVLRGGHVQVKAEGKADENELTKEVPEHERYVLHGKRLATPILGHHYQLPGRSKAYDTPPILDNSLAYIPVYTHLITHDLVPIRKPETPSILAEHGSALRAAIQSKKHAKAAVSSGKGKTEVESHTSKASVFDKSPEFTKTLNST